MKNFSLFFFACIVLSACKDNVKTSDTTTITTDSVKEVIDLTQIKFDGDRHAKDIKFIPLETNENCLIANVSKVLIKNDTLIVCDNKFNQIHSFDINGKHLNSFGSIGRGPGEYLSAEDISFNLDSTSLIVLSNNSKKILEYTLEGKHTQDLTMDIFGSKIAIAKDGNTIIYINKNVSPYSEKFDLLRLNANGDILNRSFKIEKEGDYAVSYSGFLGTGLKGEILFNNAFRDTIYEIDGPVAKARYVFKLGNKELTDKSNASISNLLESGGNYNFLTQVFFEFKDEILFGIHSNGMVYSILLDFEKGSKERLSFPLNNIVGQDKFQNVYATFSPLVKVNEANTDYFKEAIKNYTSMGQALERVNIEANPIIVKYSLF